MQRLDVATMAGAVLCGVVAAWLFAAVLLVLPARSPDAAPAWTVVAGVLLLLALASGRRSLGASRTTTSEFVVGILAAVAVAGAAWLALGQLIGRAEFEGYVVLVAAAALGQGLLVLASLYPRWPSQHRR